MAKESIKRTPACSFDLLKNRILFWLETVAWHFKLEKCVRLEQKHLLVLISFVGSAATISSLIYGHCQTEFLQVHFVRSWSSAAVLWLLQMSFSARFEKALEDKSHQSITSVRLTEMITSCKKQALLLFSTHTEACNWKNIARQLIKNWLELGEFLSFTVETITMIYNVFLMKREECGESFQLSNHYL